MNTKLKYYRTEKEKQPILIFQSFFSSSIWCFADGGVSHGNEKCRRHWLMGYYYYLGLCLWERETLRSVFLSFHSILWWCEWVRSFLFYVCSCSRDLVYVCKCECERVFVCLCVSFSLHHIYTQALSYSLARSLARIWCVICCMLAALPLNVYV